MTAPTPPVTPPASHVYHCHVRFSDVDVYGHVNNVKYFEYFQEARISFLRELGGEVRTSGNERQVVARVEVDYVRPILFRPEPYAVESWVTRVGTSSYDLTARIVDRPSAGENGPGEVAAGTTYSTSTVRLVAYDLSHQRSRPLSAAEREALQLRLVAPDDD